jgi:hypothetical protein
MLKTSLKERPFSGDNFVSNTVNIEACQENIGAKIPGSVERMPSALPLGPEIHALHAPAVRRPAGRRFFA